MHKLGLYNTGIDIYCSLGIDLSHEPLNLLPNNSQGGVILVNLFYVDLRFALKFAFLLRLPSMYK